MAAAKGDATLKKMFDKFDLNGDGSITRKEIRALLDEAGYCLSEDDLQAFIAQADHDNSGTITFAEFSNSLQNQQSQQKSLAKLRQLFRSMDVDGSGHITLKDLRTLVKESGASPMDEEQLKRIILKMDKNGDKKVSFKEFSHFMMSQPQGASGNIFQ